MKNCFSACISSFIQATSKSGGKIAFELQFLQCIMGSPVVESTSSCPGVPTVVESTYSCPEYLQLSKNLQLSGLSTAVENIFSCREHLRTSRCWEHLQFYKVPPVVENTSSCREYLQLSRTPPVVENTSSCREYLQLSKHLQLSKVPPVVERDFCKTGSVIVTK